MILRRTLLAALGAAALIGSTLVTASSAEAQACAGRYTGEASGLLRAATGIAARQDWRTQVRRDLGFSYGFWSRASRRVTRCFRRPAGGNWHCTARANPCG